MTRVLRLDADPAPLRGPGRRRLSRVAMGLTVLCANAVADGVKVQDALVTALRDEATSYEHGDGVAKDLPRAVTLYCRAARQGDAVSQFNLGWIYATGRGVRRNDALAAYFFAAAAQQGIDQARHMLEIVGGQASETPDCMREPALAEEDADTASKSPSGRIESVAPKKLVDLVKKMAPDYRVAPKLVLTIMAIESNFNHAAVSPKNAMGLMQLVPDTAARFNVQDAYDPKQNIRGGLAYLRWLLAYFEGDLTLVAAAYNAGEGAVERYGGVPPYAETRRYVRRVVSAVGSAVHPFDASITQPSPQLRSIRAANLRKE